MSVTSINSDTSQIIQDLMEKYNHKDIEREPSAEMGKDDFMKLLITQMKHQDPTAPMDNSQMISQQAQFTEMEQMQNLNDNFESLISMLSNNAKTDAVSYLGKEVKIADPETAGEYFTGRVEEVVFKEGTPMLVVNGAEIPVSDVYSLTEPVKAETSL